MLFDSYIFIFSFLPVCLLIYHLLTKYELKSIALSWLVLASLFFYAWWNPKYLPLLLLSMTVNYGLARILCRRVQSNQKNQALLFFGIAMNLAFIGYFKYAYFFLSNISPFLGTSIHAEQLILPLGISFFTFQKIALLVDASRGQIKHLGFKDYCLFVSFFPQLIAGPIVQHKQIIPQLKDNPNFKISLENLSYGFTLFFIGLIKKIGIADSIAIYANAAFDGAAQGVVLSFWEAWGGALAYAFQLYFDFSGYTDMALGLGCLFGIKLPLNFYSPYKATSIIDFWQRWHISLSTFLRDYLYIPLGGNRSGHFRRYINLVLTMLLGGLWHGANWTFVLWGAMHGIFLAINHFWRALLERFKIVHYFQNRPSILGFKLLTFMLVVLAWVPFRAQNVEIAFQMMHSMLSFDNLSLPAGLAHQLNFLQQWLPKIQFKGMFHHGLADWYLGLPFLLGLSFIAMNMPNTMEMMRYPITHPKIAAQAQSWWLWRPNTVWALAMAAVFLLSLILLSQESEFLYFQF